MGSLLLPVRWRRKRNCSLSIFVLTIAAAEVAIGLALIVSLYRARRTASTQDLHTLKD